jgi:hypothetical protein
MNTAIKGDSKMEYKFAVALLKGDDETIMGIFDTKEEADAFGKGNVVSHEKGLQYCFSAMFMSGEPQGNSMRIYDYYNVAPVCLW